MKFRALSQSRLWRRFGMMQVWGWPFLWFTVAITSLLSYAFDAVRLNNFTLLWVPINLCASAVALIFIVAAVLLAMRLGIRAPYTTPFNFIVAATGMGLKNMFTLLFCYVFGVQDTGDLWFRFFGGFTIGIGIFMIYGNIVANRLERSLILDDLQAKERTLIGFRENIQEIFTEEEEGLRQRTMAELLPRFLALQERVEFGSDVKSLTSDLQKLLTQEVKPLSADLAREAAKLSKFIPEPKSDKLALPEIRVKLYDMIRPGSSFICTLLSWWMLAQIALPQSGISDVAIASLVYWGCLVLARFALLPVKEVKMVTAWALATLISFAATIPSYYLFYQIDHTNLEGLLIPALLVSGTWVSMIFSHSQILDLIRAQTENQLKEVVSKFSRENKILEQKLWIAQHVWFTLIHGTVQSALTAASIRAANKTTLEKSERLAIVRDLRRAIEALRNPVHQKTSLRDSLIALTETWEGILEVEVDLDAKANAKISSSEDVTLMVNEVLKEAVSNAVKHGDASQVKVMFDLNQNNDIVLTVSNNGKKPKPTLASGIGSKIMDSLCLNHSLIWNSDINQTQLLATIPLA